MSLTMNAMVMMMATAPEMIYHHLFYDSNKTKLSAQVETSEQLKYSFNAHWKKNYHMFS